MGDFASITCLKGDPIIFQFKLLVCTEIIRILEAERMITKFHGINVSSRNPERFVKFYNEKLGVPILQKDKDGYDGAELGFIEGSPVITIWDENQWGKSTEGAVNFVFRCDDLDKTYKELKAKGVSIDPPITAVWGGKELQFLDPDGNKVLLL